MALIKKWQGFLVAVTNYCIFILSVCFTSIVIYAIFSRYVFDFSLVWIEEIVRFFMAWIVFVGLSVVIFARGHMAMEAIFLMLPGNYRKAVRIGSDILIGIFLVVVVVEGWKLAIGAWHQTSPVASVRYFWPYLSLPIGAALGVVHLSIFLAEDILSYRSIQK